MAVFLKRLSVASICKQAESRIERASSTFAKGGLKWSPATNVPVGALQFPSMSRTLFTSSARKNTEFAEPSAASPQGQPAPNRIEKTVNNITLMGRVGADPQKRGTAEHPVVVFSLATHANYNYQDGGMLQKTDWHRVCVFKPYLRDTVYKFMTKGQRVYITGRVSYGEIKDEQGNAHVATSIIAEDVIFITDSASRNRGGNST